MLTYYWINFIDVMLYIWYVVICTEISSSKVFDPKKVKSLYNTLLHETHKYTLTVLFLLEQKLQYQTFLYLKLHTAARQSILLNNISASHIYILGCDADPSPPSVPWSWKGRAIPLLPLWAVRPVQSLSACTGVTFTLLLAYLYL